MAQTNDILVDFALDAANASVLATYEDWLIKRDIYFTEHEHILGKNLTEVKQLKAQWHRAWREQVEGGFSAMEPERRPRIWNKDELEFREQAVLLRKSSNRLPAGLILLELAAFEAYWPFTKGERSFKGLTLVSGAHESFLERVSRDLGFPQGQGKELRKSIESSQKAISHFWYKLGAGVMAGMGLGALAFGIAAPFIGGLIGGAMGLSGAAATSAGLAFLGGGSIAAGGFGMAGGMAVIVGGGAMLGVSTGAAGGRVLASITSETTLLASAKLEVVLREFVLQGQSDMAHIQEILLAQRRTIQALEEEVDRLRLAGEASDKRLEELRKSVKLMRTAHERNLEMASA